MMLNLNALSLRYDNNYQALSNITTNFPHGSFTALVGPSGCGKSSLLRAIAGLVPISSGRLDAPPAKNIGYVFQEPTLLAWKSVFDNIALPLKISGLSAEEIDKRTQEALTLVGLHDFTGALPRQLSGGMRMRVSLARALAKRPPLLLLDEPFAALDELTRFRLDDDLRAIWQQQNSTIIFVTHSVTEAAYLAERVLVLQAGQLCDEIKIAQAGRDASFRASRQYHQACQDISTALGHDSEHAL